MKMLTVPFGTKSENRCFLRARTVARALLVASVPFLGAFGISIPQQAAAGEATEYPTNAPTAPTRARVTQVLGMLRLAPEIRNRIVTLPKSVRPSSVTERLIRHITAITDYHDQIREFQKLLG